MKKILIGLVFCVYFSSCDSIKSKIETTLYDDINYDNLIVNKDVIIEQEDPLVASDNSSVNDVVEIKTFSKEAKVYFEKVVKKEEFVDGSRDISKWKNDIKIYVKGERRDYLVSELNKIVSELNDLISEIEIYVVDREIDANFVVFFGTENEYNIYEINSVNFTKNNFGLFVMYGGNSFSFGNMYVDIERTKSRDAQRHLLREELTQSLGLINDTYDYPESIFYQGWTETTEYAPIDRELIQMLYN
jgi:hypothetical protein